jgi:chromosome segregation protein
VDEFDMYLGRNNAEHVGGLFRENSRKSQIVMISLKGAVSKFADNILGVTTDKKGNTVIIEKNLNEKTKKDDVDESR